MGGRLGPPPFRRPPAPPPPWLVNNRAMDVDVRGHFLSLYERGMLRPGDLDPACMPFLQGLPKNVAGSALDEFSSLDHTRYFPCQWAGTSLFFCSLLPYMSLPGQGGRHLPCFLAPFNPSSLAIFHSSPLRIRDLTGVFIQICKDRVGGGVMGGGGGWGRAGPFSGPPHGGIPGGGGGGAGRFPESSQRCVSRVPRVQPSLRGVGPHVLS